MARFTLCLHFSLEHLSLILGTLRRGMHGMCREVLPRDQCPSYDKPRLASHTVQHDPAATTQLTISTTQLPISTESVRVVGSVCVVWVSAMGLYLLCVQACFFRSAARLAAVILVTSTANNQYHTAGNQHLPLHYTDFRRPVASV